MNYEDILTASLLIIINDQDTGEMDLGSILGGKIKAVKGPRKPDKWDECFTLHIPSNHRDPDTKINNGTLNINYYCPNHPSGNADTEKHGAVVARLIVLFDDNPPDLPGYKIGDWSVREPLGPIPVQDNPDKESYSSVRIGFRIQKR